MPPRLPSFNDFSPGLLGDLRPILKAVSMGAGSDEVVFETWEKFLPGWNAKRLRTNIPATLRSTGLTSGRPMQLTDFGDRVQSAKSAKDAAGVFCAEIINAGSGLKLIEAIRNLQRRVEKATKVSLQVELQRLGVVDLANDTTDHTTLKNWMIQAGIVQEERRNFPTIDDAALKSLTGISSTEHDELQSLTQAQQVFLHLLRKRHITEVGPFDVSDLYTECKATHPHAFGSANLASSVKDPLSEAGWIQVSKPRGGGRGGKSGWVAGTARLLDIPINRLVPDFSSTIPADLHPKLQTPLSKIKEWLDGTNTHQGGLALELLALRVILDLRLAPRHFRLRSRDSAFAEVDVTAEGTHLLFSRWTFQCKRIQREKNVGLGDVAKEVGIAVYMRAHVIVMVSTGGFSREALNYAHEIARATHLQFLFLDRHVIETYLTEGPASLHDFVMRNASTVMSQKHAQFLSPASS